MASENKPARHFVAIEYTVRIEAPVSIYDGALATLLYRSPRIARRIAEAVDPDIPRACTVKVQEIES